MYIYNIFNHIPKSSLQSSYAEIYRIVWLLNIKLRIYIFKEFCITNCIVYAGCWHMVVL